MPEDDQKTYSMQDIRNMLMSDCVTSLNVKYIFFFPFPADVPWKSTEQSDDVRKHVCAHIQHTIIIVNILWNTSIQDVVIKRF